MVHHSKFLYSALVVSAMAVSANAQVTTSAISGKVLDETKAPVIGATVVAIHEPSGTLYGAYGNEQSQHYIVHNVMALNKHIGIVRMDSQAAIFTFYHTFAV
jgi:hypothetical protein